MDKIDHLPLSEIMLKKEAEKADWLPQQKVCHMLAVEFQKKGRAVTFEMVKEAFSELGLLYDFDYFEKLAENYYSPETIDLLRKSLSESSEKSEKAPEGWRSVGNMIQHLREKKPNLIDQKHYFRTLVLTFLKNLKLNEGVDFKIYLGENNQLNFHFSPEIVDQVENFLINYTANLKKK